MRAQAEVDEIVCSANMLLLEGPHAQVEVGIVLTETEAAKLHAVPGDMSQPNLGLKDHDLQH
jgi:hypothetical protein